ncbi:FadR/GntR family transcriptional regulator [Falsarthrobacter nasiphocae]|uniref:GntR family transcriptional repressor for pyruvate dehydrogenase complex n=1 Tax=Falsarthrobacter nasiphocae TaxID=189863 RepID=A0AAE3YIA9_9MICC|nr:FCD domain-containing protein [Falsarthrobacter nasiphocae]MDR6892276.1 GntR family transcriptional repressor for pyruvate dehydrogenase complex [Falsarthrobacter nasiphocae]
MNTAASEPQGRSYETVLREVEEGLRSGSLRLGDRLPGERALAAEHGISRASVRDAIRILSVLGVVRSAPGSGPESGTVIIAEPSAGLSAALRLHMASSSLPAEDVIETRVILETWGAREAARRVARGDVEPERLEHLRGLLERMDSADTPAEEFHLLDTQFHTEATALAGNVVIETVMGSLREAIRSYVTAAVATMPHWGEVAGCLRQQHHEILDALAEGRGDDAAGLVESHIRWFDALRRGMAADFDATPCS